MAVPGPFTASSGPGGGHFLGVEMDYAVVGMGGYSGLGGEAYRHHAAANAGVDNGDDGGETTNSRGSGNGNGNESDRHLAMREQERRQGSGYRHVRHENAMSRQQNQSRHHQYQPPPSSVSHDSHHHSSQQQRQQGPEQDLVLYGRHHQDAAPAVPYKLGQAKLVVDPPGLQAWREKLFHVDDLIVLTHEQFETYFPHIDNVYSHRSTQQHKRKPFVSHYWDCRMKGRPPGTPKSDDPSKKKRKRSARERDLCDVKIKITEYLPDGGADAALDRDVAAAIAAGTAAANAVVGTGQRFWTIQRVNGNGGNGKGDGVAGPHRHSLERSDEIKKSSVQRFVAMRDRETKRPQVSGRKRRRDFSP